METLWDLAKIIAYGYAGLFLLVLFIFSLTPVLFYTGELLLYCFVPGYRIGRKPFDPEPLREHRLLSENSVVVGLFFWVMVLILLYLVL
ncbi:MAG: hypothetical protein V1792_04850 [Pseudomonadota bacterium]